MQYIFFNTAGLLRSGWRFAVFMLSFIFTAELLRALGQIALGRLQIAPEPGSGAYLAANAALALVPAIVIGWLCAKHLEHLPFRSLGASFSKGWLKHLTFGLALGALTFALAALLAFIAGGLTFQVNTASASMIASSLVVSFVIFAIGAAFEEALFRGYILQTFARSGYAWPAILLTAGFFAFVHMGNPNAGVISTLNTFLAGIWFGLAYMITRDLWFVWGLHLMWNWTQASVFGIEVSGLTMITAEPLLMEIDNGPAWLTGADYGVEGGVVCTIALIASMLFIHYYPGLRPDPEMLALTSEDGPATQPVS